MKRYEEAAEVLRAEGYSVTAAAGTPLNPISGTCPRGHSVFIASALSVLRYGQRCNDCRHASRRDHALAQASAAGYQVQLQMQSIGSKREMCIAGACSRGHEFSSRLSRFLAGERCLRCRRLETAERHELEARTQGYDVAVERRGKSELWLTGTCPSGHEFHCRAAHFTSGTRCKICAKATAKSQLYLAQALSEGWSVSLENDGYDFFLAGACNQGHALRVRTDTFARGGRCQACRNEDARVRQLIEAEGEGYRVSIQLRQLSTQSKAYFVGHCPEGHPVLMSVTGFGLGRRCRSCAKSGFRTSEPAHLYVLCGTHPGVGEVVKIGVANNLKSRLATHGRGLFDSEGAIIAMSGIGRHVLDLETRVKHALRARGARSCRELGYVFDGATETYPAAEVPHSELLLLVEECQEANRCAIDV